MAAKPFTFTPTDFKDGSAGGTPITAAELNKINLGISNLYEALPVYTVKTTSDTPPSTPCLMTVIDAKGAYQGTWYNDGTATTPVGQPPVKTYTGTAKPTSDYYSSVTITGQGRSVLVRASFPTGVTFSGYDYVTMFVIPPEAAPREPVYLTFPFDGASTGANMFIHIDTTGILSLSMRTATVLSPHMLDFTYQLN